MQAFEALSFHSVTTTDDPVTRAQIKPSGCNVFTTDAILACIAAAPRSVYSWDLVFHHVGGTVLIDKRCVRTCFAGLNCLLVLGSIQQSSCQCD